MGWNHSGKAKLAQRWNGYASRRLEFGALSLSLGGLLTAEAQRLRGFAETG